MNCIVNEWCVSSSLRTINFSNMQINIITSRLENANLDKSITLESSMYYSATGSLTDFHPEAESGTIPLYIRSESR